MRQGHKADSTMAHQLDKLTGKFFPHRYTGFLSATGFIFFFCPSQILHQSLIEGPNLFYLSQLEFPINSIFRANLRIRE